MQSYRGKTLEGWIEHGRATGRIQRVLTVTKAYCMFRHEALHWVAQITTGAVNEDEALAAFGVESSDDDILARGYVCERLDPDSDFGSPGGGIRVSQGGRCAAVEQTRNFLAYTNV